MIWSLFYHYLNIFYRLNLLFDMTDHKDIFFTLKTEDSMLQHKYIFSTVFQLLYQQNSNVYQRMNTTIYEKQLKVNPAASPLKTIVIWNCFERSFVSFMSIWEFGNFILDFYKDSVRFEFQFLKTSSYFFSCHYECERYIKTSN